MSQGEFQRVFIKPSRSREVADRQFHEAETFVMLLHLSGFLSPNNNAIIAPAQAKNQFIDKQIGV
jgi:hypothetical protein